MPNQFAEIHTPISSVIKSRFSSIALIFNIADFHVEVECTSHCPRTYHHIALCTTDFIVFFDVSLIGFADNILKKRAFFDALLFHLHPNKIATEGHFPDVKSAATWHFYKNPIARSNVRVAWIMKKFFTRTIFETHFREVKIADIMYI